MSELSDLVVSEPEFPEFSELLHLGRFSDYSEGFSVVGWLLG